jgi:hypothetical protein
VTRKARQCWAGPEEPWCQLYGTEVAVPAVNSCQFHAGDSAAALFTAGASLVLVTGPQRAKAAGRKSYPELAEVMERVRRAGAHSADEARLEAMERELHVAVLAAIADGAPQARELAATALLTLQYGHERRRA